MTNFSNSLNSGNTNIVLQPIHLMGRNTASNAAVPANTQVTNPPVQEAQPEKSSLSEADKLANLSSVISSGIAGGLASSKIVANTGLAGESMRAAEVLNSFNNLRSQAPNSVSFSQPSGMYGSNYNNYNSYEYDSYSTELRRGGGNRNYAGYESNNSPRTPVLSEYDQQGMKIEARSQVVRDIANGTLQGAKYGVLIGGAVSALTNGFNVITGKTQGKEAVGRVAADTITAGVSGASGALVGGLASFGLGMVGVGGLPGLVIATGVGVAGAAGSQLFMQKTGIYDSLKNKVKSVMGK